MKLTHKPGWIATGGLILILIIFLSAIGMAVHNKNELFLLVGPLAFWIIFPLTLEIDFRLTDQLIAQKNPY